MSKNRDIKVTADAIGCGSVVIDGHDMSDLASGIDLSARVGNLTRATLYVPAVHFDAAIRGTVELSPEITEMLIALGWTPPPADVVIDGMAAINQQIAEEWAAQTAEGPDRAQG